MSQVEKDTTIVYLTRKSKSDKRYHTTTDPDECHTCPENPKPIEKWKIEGHYQPCAICTDENPDTRHSCNQADYVCSECGTERRLGVVGVRTRHACHECNDVTSWRRTHDVRQ